MFSQVHQVVVVDFIEETLKVNVIDAVADLINVHLCLPDGLSGTLFRSEPVVELRKLRGKQGV